MLENASQVHVPAPEDSLERKRIQSQGDFEPLPDTDEAARLLRMHPRTLRTKRSEEHTSELQSPCNLVCRLLLEKKKHNPAITLSLNLKIYSPDNARCVALIRTN